MENKIVITLTEVSAAATEFLFPSLPESIRVKNGAKYQSYDILGTGSIRIPRGMESGTIGWDGIFYGKASQKNGLQKAEESSGKLKWISPADCKNILTRWMEQGTILQLSAATTGINYDVTISEFEFKEYGAYGNAQYSISFFIYRPVRFYTTAESNTRDMISRVRPEPQKPTSYTVASGDNLWKIARKFYGSGSEWTKLYQANQEILEEEAKKRGLSSSDKGNRIFPGTVLSVP